MEAGRLYDFFTFEKKLSQADETCILIGEAFIEKNEGKREIERVLDDGSWRRRDVVDRKEGIGGYRIARTGNQKREDICNFVS